MTSTDIGTGASTFTWVTSINPASGTTTAGQPRLVKLSDSQFALIFQIIDTKTKTTSLEYRLIDQYGKTVASKSFAGVAYWSNTQPVLTGSRLTWVNFGNSDKSYLYELNLANPADPSLVTK